MMHLPHTFPDPAPGVQAWNRRRNAPLLHAGEPKPVRTTPKIPRNEPCPCGSGRKAKKCCHGSG